jgi:hypothetical protein
MRLWACDIVDDDESHDEPDVTEECCDRDTAPDSGVKYRPEASDG